MEKEICARCGKETEYLVSTPVMTRRFSVEGAGQLCSECWRKLYEREEDISAEGYIDNQSTGR